VIQNNIQNLKKLIQPMNIGCLLGQMLSSYVGHTDI